MMFKKKNDLPPRPKPPTNEQILEDISNSASDDPVFKECTRYNLDDEINTVDASYLRIKEFIEVNRNLKSILIVLKDQNSSLQNSIVELQSMAEHIRQQATEALK